MLTESSEEFIHKLKIGEDLAYRLQKPEWQARANREKLESLIKEALDYVRRTALMNKLKRLDLLVKAQAELEQIHDPGTRDSKQRLEAIFYLLRCARQGR